VLQRCQAIGFGYIWFCVIEVNITRMVVQCFLDRRIDRAAQARFSQHVSQDLSCMCAAYCCHQ